MSDPLLSEDLKAKMRAAGMYPIKPHFLGGKEEGKRALKKLGLWNPDFE